MAKDKSAVVEEPKGEEIPVEAPEKDDDDEVVSAKETPEQRETRRERRRERGNLHKELSATKEHAERIEREFQEHRNRTEREMQVLRLERAQERQKAEPAVDPIKRELAPVLAEEDAILMKWRQLTDEQQAASRDEYMEKVRDIEYRKGVLYAKAAQPAHRAEDPAAEERRVNQAILRGKFPQVYANNRALAYAHATYNARVAKGASDSSELADEVMRDTMAEFGIGAPPDVSRSDRSRHVSVSRGGRPDAAKTPKTIVMSQVYKDMADEAYSHIKNEKERHAMWAQKVGSKLVAKDA